MIIGVNKEDYKTYTKIEKRVYWALVVVVACGALLALAWKPYILPLLK